LAAKCTVPFKNEKDENRLSVLFLLHEREVIPTLAPDLLKQIITDC